MEKKISRNSKPLEAFNFWASFGEKEKESISSAFSCYGRSRRQWAENKPFSQFRANSIFQALLKGKEAMERRIEWAKEKKESPQNLAYYEGKLSLFNAIIPKFEAEGFKPMKAPKSRKAPKCKKFKGGLHLFQGIPNNSEGKAFYEALKKFKIEGIQAIRRGRGPNSHYSEAWGKRENKHGHGEKGISECPEFSIYLKAKGKGYISPQNIKGESLRRLQEKLREAQGEYAKLYIEAQNGKAQKEKALASMLRAEEAKEEAQKSLFLCNKWKLEAEAIAREAEGLAEKAIEENEKLREEAKHLKAIIKAQNALLGF